MHREQGALRGLGRFQVRLLAALKRGPSTARQLSEWLEHDYDCTCGTLSALLKSGLVADMGMTRGPTKQPARLYGVVPAEESAVRCPVKPFLTEP